MSRRGDREEVRRSETQGSRLARSTSRREHFEGWPVPGRSVNDRLAIRGKARRPDEAAAEGQAGEPRRRDGLAQEGASGRGTQGESAQREDGRPRFVAGAIGPTNRTASISPDVANPGFRAITFDELRAAYAEQVAGLIDGGADLLLVETIFDTLNAKAAIAAIADVVEAGGVPRPVMISGTITDRSGRLLSGQTPAAFWNSVRHAAPFSIGLNCALGAGEMRAHIAEIARVADTFVCAYPNAGLPNEFGGYDEGPALMASLLDEFAQARQEQLRASIDRAGYRCLASRVGGAPR